MDTPFAKAGRRLRRARGKQSQSRMAQQLGISRSFLSRLESGEHRPDFDLAFEIEKIHPGVPAVSWLRSKAA